MNIWIWYNSYSNALLLPILGKLLKNNWAGRFIDASCDQKAGFFPAQRIGITIQCRNVVSLLGTLSVDDDMEFLTLAIIFLIIISYYFNYIILKKLDIGR